MSMDDNDPPAEDAPVAAAAAAPAAGGDQDEDAAMQMALQMSMQPEEASKEQFQDPNFVNQWGRFLVLILTTHNSECIACSKEG